ncbi:MAG TPA: hypothetical protein VFT34_07520 [Verrucomicrobiae bacterium]|nr:hypothetical protein [Verrucomicrobiae bacterium]
MKFLVQLLGVIVAAGLGLGMGLAWRAKAQRRPYSPELGAETPTRSDDSRERGFLPGRKRMVTRVHDDSPLATQLAHDLSRSSRVTRWLYWLEAIEKASLSDFPRLASLANGDATATRLVASRWVQLDLGHLFNTLAAAQDRRTFPMDELADVLFLEWARRDPDAAISALQGTNDLGTREAWRMNVAGYLVEKDPERGLRALSEWGIDNFAPRMTGVTKWAAASPRHAAEVVLAHPAGYTSELAIETIGKGWSRTDPAGAMEFACARPGSLASSLASTVLKSWAGRDIQQAAAWLAEADVTIRRRLSPAFVEAWAKVDPNNALAWCESNLTGSSLAQTLGSIVNSVAQSNLMAAAEFVTSMKLSPARAEAAAAVAKNWFPAWRSGKPAPTDALTWLAGLDPASTRRALEQVQWKWSNGDPKSMAEFLATIESDKVPRSADLNVARSLTRQSPPEAFVWASRLPTDRSLAASREAFAEWRHSQPELAKKWLNDLPPSDPRRKAFLQ